jgi:DNA-binding transcriptional regulator YdaS (Cro superfamily)
VSNRDVLREAAIAAIEIAGGPTALARLLNANGAQIRVQSVREWAQNGRIPEGRVIEVERALSHLPGAPTRHDLRPDLSEVFACESCREEARQRALAALARFETSSPEFA